MDPVNILGLIATCGTLAKTTVTGIQGVYAYCQTYSAAEQQLQALSSRLASIRAALSGLRGWIQTHGRKIDKDMLEALQGTIESCHVVLSAVNTDVEKFKSLESGENKMRIKNRVRYTLSEGSIDIHSRTLDSQIGALNLVVNIMKMRGRASYSDVAEQVEHPDQGRNLHTRESRIVFKEAADSATLYDVPIDDSRSIAYTHTGPISKQFDFDDILVNSAAYRAVLYGALDKSKVAESSQEIGSTPSVDNNDKQGSTQSTAGSLGNLEFAEHLVGVSKEPPRVTLIRPRTKPTLDNRPIASSNREKPFYSNWFQQPPKTELLSENPLLHIDHHEFAEEHSRWAGSLSIEERVNLIDLDDESSGWETHPHEQPPSITRAMQTNLAEGIRLYDTPPEDLVGAIKRGNKLSVRTLITYGADVKQKDKETGLPCLALACSLHGADSELIELLLDAGAKASQTYVDLSAQLEYTVLHQLASARRTASVVETIRMLLGNGADINFSGKEGVEPLHCFCNYWYTGIEGKENQQAIRFFIEQGADVRCQDWLTNTPLTYACCIGNREMAELLLSFGAPVAKGNPLWKAAREGHSYVIDLLLSVGANVHQEYYGNTPLIIAASRGYLEVVWILLNNGANVHVRDIYGQTALECATRDSHDEVAQMLIKYGAAY